MREKFEFEKLNSFERLVKFIEIVSEMQRKEGLLVDNFGRIEMGGFKGIFGEKVIEGDKKYIAEIFRKIYGNLREEEILNKRLESDGEKLELLKQAVFYKNLRERALVVRSSLYDDLKNKVDNILIERGTGNIICAFDEVSDISGIEHENKERKIHQENEKGGVSLKYGLVLDKDGKIILGSLSNIPIFYLALPRHLLIKIINGFKPSLEEQSDLEKNLFSYFINSIRLQIDKLKLSYLTLDEKLKSRLDLFSRFIEKLD